MLNNDHFYFSMFRKYIIAFEHIINDIHIIRTDKDDNPVKDIRIPITYATKSKLFHYIGRNSSGRKIRTILPRISFVITGMEYDVSRKLNNLIECPVSTDIGKETFRYPGVPYNFSIEMHIWSIYMDDLLQIIEQLATFFKPDFSMTVKEIEELGVERSIPVILNGINFDIENEFDTEDRVLMANASFTLKGFLYPPIKDSNIIENIILNMKEMDMNDKTIEQINIDWDKINETIVTTIKDSDFN